MDINTKTEIKNKSVHNGRKSATAGVVLSVFSVVICFFIILGGFDTNGNISDIFTGEYNHNEQKKSSGVLPVNYESGNLSYTLAYNRDDDIVLTYGKTNERYIFKFNGKSKLQSVYDGTGDKITGFIYKDGITGELFYENGIITGYNEYSVVYDRNSNKTATVNCCNKDGDILTSRRSVFDRNGNIKEFLFTDGNGNVISSYKKNYVYDDAGRISVINMTSSDGENTRSVYKYDESGNPIYSCTVNNDITTSAVTYSYQYNGNGDISRYTESTDLPYSDKTEEYIYLFEYNKDGKLTKSEKQTENGTVISSVTTGYNSVGNISSTVNTDYINRKTVKVKYNFYGYQHYEKMNFILGYWNFEEKTAKLNNNITF